MGRIHLDLSYYRRVFVKYSITDLGVSPLFPDPEARHSVVGSSRKILFTEESLTTDALSVDVGSLNYTIENIHRSSLSTYHRVPWTTVCTCPLCQPGQFESHTP